MKTINIILGAPLTGKSEWIQTNYADASKYFHLDYAKTFLALFNSYDDENLDKVCEVRNKMREDLVEYFYFGKHEIVFEYCTGFEESDKELFDLIELIHSMDIKVKVIQLDCSVEEALRRGELVKYYASYYSSYHLNEEIIAILRGFLDTMVLNDELDLN